MNDKFYNRIIERNNKLNNNYNKGEKNVFYNFFKNYESIIDVLILSEKKEIKASVKHQVRKNYIIGLVSCLEQFFKQLIKYDLTEYNDNIKELLKEKVTLWEASKIFSEKKLKPHDIIANHYSFQSLSEIDRVFTSIIGENFLNLIGNFDTGNFIPENKEKTTFILNKDYPNWRNDISELFNLRHNFVHHFNYKEKVQVNKVNRVQKPVLSIVMTIFIVFEKKSLEANIKNALKVED